MRRLLFIVSIKQRPPVPGIGSRPVEGLAPCRLRPVAAGGAAALAAVSAAGDGGVNCWRPAGVIDDGTASAGGAPCSTLRPVGTIAPLSFGDGAAPGDGAVVAGDGLGLAVVDGEGPTLPPAGDDGFGSEFPSDSSRLLFASSSRLFIRFVISRSSLSLSRRSLNSLLIRAVSCSILSFRSLSTRSVNSLIT